MSSAARSRSRRAEHARVDTPAVRKSATQLELEHEMEQLGLDTEDADEYVAFILAKIKQTEQDASARIESLEDLTEHYSREVKRLREQNATLMDSLAAANKASEHLERRGPQPRVPGREGGCAGPSAASVTPPPGATLFTIDIKTLTAKTITLSNRVHHLTSIAMVKAYVQELEGIPLDQQRLIWRGQQLDDGALLGGLGIGKDEVVNLVLKQRGC